MMAFSIFSLSVAVMAACAATYYRRKSHKLEQSGIMLMLMLLFGFKSKKKEDTDVKG